MANVAVEPVSVARRRFLWSRLGSLLAVAPLGVWTVAHVWSNLAALRGEQAWTDSVTTYAHPVSYAVTLTLVFAPLLMHTVWGIGRLFVTRPNNVRYGYYTNLKFLLQRLSAIGVLLFLGAHVWLALLHPRLVEGHAERFGEFAHEMRHYGPTLLVYLLGTLGVSYHLANGLQTTALAFGVVVTPRAQRRLEVLIMTFFVLLLAMCWTAIYALWQAGA
ncbi:MAG: succinate dehydrogenase cytochrome B558 [Polyangiales bacterium]